MGNRIRVNQISQIAGVKWAYRKIGDREGQDRETKNGQLGGRTGGQTEGVAQRDYFPGSGQRKGLLDREGYRAGG